MVDALGAANFQRRYIFLGERRHGQGTLHRHRLVAADFTAVQHAHGHTFCVGLDHLNENGIEIDADKIANLKIADNSARIQIEAARITGCAGMGNLDNFILGDRNLAFNKGARTHLRTLCI